MLDLEDSCGSEIFQSNYFSAGKVIKGKEFFPLEIEKGNQYLLFRRKPEGWLKAKQ